MTIEEQLRREAKRQGMTTYRLWKTSGVPVSAVQRWHDGGGIRCDTAHKLADVLGFDIVLRPARRKAVRRYGQRVQ